VLQPVGQGVEDSEYLSFSRIGDMTSSQFTRTIQGTILQTSGTSQNILNEYLPSVTLRI